MSDTILKEISEEISKWPDDKERSSRLVFIGRNLETMNLKEGFEACKSE